MPHHTGCLAPTKPCPICATWHTLTDAQRATLTGQPSPKKGKAGRAAPTLNPKFDLSCVLAGEMIRQGCSGTLFRCNLDGVTASKYPCKDAQRVCQTCPDRVPPVPMLQLGMSPPDANRVCVIDQGAGGLGDAMQGLWVVAGLSADNHGEPIRYNFGPVEKWVDLFDVPSVTYGRTARVHNEDPVPGAIAMNLGYTRERETQIATPRWERYMRNVGATRLVQPRLRDASRVKSRGVDHAGAIVLCPWSTGRWSEWSVQAWLTLENRLHAAGYRTVILHIEAKRCERFKGAKVIHQSPERVAGVMLNAACVVGIDSGLAHLAGTLGAPLIVLGGATRVEQIFGMYPTANCVQGSLGCSGCFNLGPDCNDTCRENCANIHSVTPDRVFAEVDRVVLSGIVAGRSLISPDRLAAIRDAVRETNHLDGDVAELGVYRGGSAKLIRHYAGGAMLHLFDTFAGIPEGDSDPGGEHVAGDFAAELDEVVRFVGESNAAYHVGAFPEIVPKNVRYRFVHVDGDTYQTTQAALAYFVPRMLPGGIMIFDDYEWRATPGVMRAIHESFPVDRVERSAEHQARVRF